MTHQKNVPAPEHNHHCQVPKTIKKRPKSLHLTHQMTHGMTHDKFVSVSLLAEMTVITNTPGLFNKNYSTRFLPLLTSPVKDDQMAVYKMAELTGMAHSLDLNSSTI